MLLSCLDMENLTNKRIGVFIAILTIVSYFIPIIPGVYKFHIILIGFSVSIIVLFRSSLENKLIRPIIKKICKTSEKYFRFLYVEKTVLIDEKGNGKCTTIYKLLNECGLKRHFPIKFWTDTGTMVKTIEQMESENKFEVKSLDEHPLSWQVISDSINSKEFCVVFDRDLQPGETRTYLFRFDGEGLYKTQKSELQPNKKESTGFLPIHLNELIKLKVRFLPGYEYSELRYCVKSPSKEEVGGKCRNLQPLIDRDTGGTYVEIEEKYPWRNFLYTIEWFPEN